MTSESTTTAARSPPRSPCARADALARSCYRENVDVTTTNDLEHGTPPRTRRPLVIIAIVAVLAVAGLAVAYATFFTDDAPERLALSDQPAPTTGAPATTVAGQTATTAVTTATTPAAGADLAGT